MKSIVRAGLVILTIILVTITLVFWGFVFIEIRKGLRDYSEVDVGESFFGSRDDYYTKLPNNYVINGVYKEGNTVYWIWNYKNPSDDPLRITDYNVTHYYCIDEIVLLKCSDETGTPRYYALLTGGKIYQNLIEYESEKGLMDDYNASMEIEWEEA